SPQALFVQALFRCTGCVVDPYKKSAVLRFTPLENATGLLEEGCGGQALPTCDLFEQGPRVQCTHRVDIAVLDFQVLIEQPRREHVRRPSINAGDTWREHPAIALIFLLS